MKTKTPNELNPRILYGVADLLRRVVPHGDHEASLIQDYLSALGLHTPTSKER